MNKFMDCKFKVSHVFGGQDVAFTLYKGLLEQMVRGRPKH